MKSVLMSIQPKWCELIASGIKTVEVRKSKPKLETPFKAYIYQTKKQWVYSVLRKMGLNDLVNKLALGTGKVIGEFVCDSLDTVDYNSDYYFTRFNTCLSTAEMWKYGREKPLFAWHISNLVIYDKPRKLSEFYKECEKPECEECPYLHFENTPNSYEGWCECNEKISLKRPPQSWCYVESEANNGE